jgi:hypothetical protein
VKIRFLSGPRKDQIDHAPRGQQTDLLIGAGLIEVLDEHDWPVAPGATDKNHTVVPYFPETIWGFAYISTTRRPAIRKTSGCSETTTFANWDGYAKPKDVADAAKKAGCPQDVIDRYLAEMKLWDERELANVRQRQGVEAANPKPPFVKVGW